MLSEARKRKSPSDEPEKFACDYPGCTKSYPKNFTLNRHKKIHQQTQDESSEDELVTPVKENQVKSAIPVTPVKENQITSYAKLAEDCKLIAQHHHQMAFGQNYSPQQRHQMELRQRYNKYNPLSTTSSTSSSISSSTTSSTTSSTSSSTSSSLSTFSTTSSTSSTHSMSSLSSSTSSTLPTSSISSTSSKMNFIKIDTTSYSMQIVCRDRTLLIPKNVDIKPISDFINEYVKKVNGKVTSM